MTARTISIEHYHDHLESGRALRQWMVILRFVERNAFCTRAQVAEITGIRLSSVCGRVKELLDAGLIVESKARVICPVTGKRVHGLVPSRRKPQQLQLVA